MLARLLCVLVAWAVAVGAPLARAQTLAWTIAATGGPVPRAGHAMAYDSARRVVVLFGGGAGVALGDTWEWDGSLWTRRAVNGPPPRALHAMAYDSARGVTVLFGGGDGSTRYGDTWEWNGATWTQRAVSGPSGRQAHAMGYDAARGVTVLFGGQTADFGTNDETWEWNGTAWMQRSISGPSPREHPAMAYDSARGVVVLFGGYTGTDSGTVTFGDTWEWNGAGGGTWTQRVAGGPAPRYGHAMAYDAARGVTYLSGGIRIGNQSSSDTWAWNGSSWAAVVGEGGVPSPRFFQAMAYDAIHSATVLFGGYDFYGFLGDTWLLSIGTSRCCSADFNNDGDAGTDGDIETFFACLAGSCCATCGSADFNCDGEIIDNDIEAFFRVLAGGSC